jgi:transcriptional regulator with GAF, ATPase, and Fis domain
VRLRLSTFEMHTGLLIVESASPSLHSAETIASLRTVSEHIALVLQDRSVRAQVEELSQRNRQRAETLNQILEVSNDLKRHRTLDDLFQSIAAAVAKSLGFQRVVLSTYERERNVFVRGRTSAARRSGARSAPARSRPKRSPAGGRSGTASRSRSTCATAAPATSSPRCPGRSRRGASSRPATRHGEPRS